LEVGLDFGFGKVVDDNMSLFGLLEQMVEVDMQNVVIKFLHFVQVY
jgi:hypothetical protein